MALARKRRLEEAQGGEYALFPNAAQQSQILDTLRSSLTEYLIQKASVHDYSGRLAAGGGPAAKAELSFHDVWDEIPLIPPSSTLARQKVLAALSESYPFVRGIVSARFVHDGSLFHVEDALNELLKREEERIVDELLQRIFWLINASEAPLLSQQGD